MLHEDIAALAEWFEQYRRTGVHLDAGYVVAVISVLNGLQAEIWTLERQVVPPNVLTVSDKLPPNVVRLIPRQAGGAR